MLFQTVSVTSKEAVLVDKELSLEIIPLSSVLDTYGALTNHIQLVNWVKKRKESEEDSSYCYEKVFVNV